MFSMLGLVCFLNNGVLLLLCNIKCVYGGEGGTDLQMNLTQRTSESLINLTLDCSTYAVRKTQIGGTKLFLLKLIFLLIT